MAEVNNRGDTVCVYGAYSKEMSQMIVQSIRQGNESFVSLAIPFWPEDNLANVFFDYLEQEDLQLLKRGGLALCYRSQPFRLLRSMFRWLSDESMQDRIGLRTHALMLLGLVLSCQERHDVIQKMIALYGTPQTLDTLRPEQKETAP